MAQTVSLDDPSGILDSLVDCVVIIGHDFVIRGVNQAAEVFFGISPSALVGHSVLDLVAEGDRVEMTARLKAILQGDLSSPLIFRIVSASGKLRWVEATGRKLNSGLNGVSESSTDASSKKSLNLSPVVVSLRWVGGRLKRELSGLEAIRRAYLISQLAGQLQTASPATFGGELYKGFEEIGSMMGANSMSVFEVEPSGRTLALRCRWEDELSALRSRVVSQPRLSVEQIPNAIKALAGPEPIYTFNTDSRLGHELHDADAAILNGVLVPLNLGDHHVGLLILSWSEERSLTDEEARFLSSLADVVAVGLNRIVTNQALITQNSLLERIFERTRVPMLMVTRHDLQVLRANSSAVELYGNGIKRLDGLSIAQVAPELAQELTTLSEMSEHEEYRDFRMLMHSNQNDMPLELELSIDTMFVLDVPSYLIVIRNVSSVA